MQYIESITFAAGIAATFFWICYLCPAIARLFHVPMAYGFYRAARENQHLSRKHYFWFVGVLGFGVGMFLLSSTDDYLRWKLLGDHFAINHLSRRLAASLVGGALFGFLTSLGRRPPELESGIND